MLNPGEKVRQKSLLSKKMFCHREAGTKNEIKIQESMALSLYTRTIPPQEHRSDSDLLNRSRMVPAARTSGQLMCERNGTRNPAVQKWGNSATVNHDT